MMFTFRSLNDLDASEGTVTLLDATENIKHKQNSDIVLVPQPTDDPNDPLNFPIWKKAIAFVSIGVFSAVGGWVLGGVGSGIVLLMDEFHTDLNDTINGSINWSILMLGCGNFVWVPLGLYFGTRPIFVAASFLLFGTTIWSAVATSWSSFVAARVLCAFAGSCGEALPAAVVRDLFFLHQRGWWMGVYMFFFQCAVFIGGIASGFIITAGGWRWHFWLVTAVSGVDALAIFFFFPETQYYRSSTIEPVQPVSRPSTEKEPTDEVPASVSSDTPTKKSYLKELSLWSGINPGIEKSTSIINLFIRPWPLSVYPAAIYSFSAFSITLGSLIAVVNTAAVVFQNPPYNMSPGIQSIGIFIPSIIGCSFGAYWGGALTDRYVAYRTRKNNGIFEPEVRLVFMILPLFIVPIGVLMYGLGVAHFTSWVCPFIGAGCVGFGLGSVPTITMTYVIEAYYPVAPEVTLLVVGLKNIFGFGFGYAVIPWIARSGYDGALGAIAGIQFAIVLFGFPLWYYGKQIRHITSKWRVVMW